MKKSSLTDLMVGCLRTAASRPDGTVLAIGFNRHNPGGSLKSYPTSTANALLKIEALVRVSGGAWGTVYKITDYGRKIIA
jgi:hypothetical protein